MRLQKGLVAVVVGLLVLGACSHNDELVVEKERALNEKAAENDNLKKRIADAESTHLVALKQIENKDAEIARLKEQSSKPPEAGETPVSTLEKGSKAPAAESPMGVVKVNDPDIEVESRSDGAVVLRLTSKELFASGSADLTAQGQKVLGKVADTLKKYPDFRISVEGHTDDTPLKKTAGRWKNNLNLSIARAISVRTFLSSKGKIPEGRMSVVGHGDTRPLVPNKSEDARARNRRVEIVLLK